MAEQALVSVIIPTFNRWPALKQTIDSVVSQHYRPIEILVVDDGSTDDTLRECEDYLKAVCEDGDLSARYFRTANGGAPAARNLGFNNSRGRYIQFLDSDDLLLPEKISDQVAALQSATSKTSVAYCAWINRFVDDQKVKSEEICQPEQLSVEAPLDVLAMHLEGWFGPSHGYLWQRDFINDVGEWDTELKADQDGDFMMRAILAGAHLVFTQKPGVVYVHHDEYRVSAGASRPSLESRIRVTEKIQEMLADRGDLEALRSSIASRYFLIARLAVVSHPDLAERCLQLCDRVCPGYEPAFTSWKYRFFYWLFGLRVAERMNQWRQQLR